MSKSTKKHNPKIPTVILFTAKFLQFLSPKLVTLFAAKLFTTPIKHKIPRRELDMDSKSLQTRITIPSINKEIVVYQYGDSSKKVLLAHGWSGRGTQLVKFADTLLDLGYSTVSFDAPGHGKSNGNNSMMFDFIASILEIDKIYGPFEVAIGHSLGGMSLLNAVKQGLDIDKLVVIGSGDKVQDILDDFVSKLELQPKIAQSMKTYFENKFGEKMEDYAAHEAAKFVKIPTLIIHDENDYEVPIFCGENIAKYLSNGTFYRSKKLGHRKILGDQEIINIAMEFIKN
jgi:pimeloyl-ACP methyl ester carboxylesterase